MGEITTELLFFYSTMTLIYGILFSTKIKDKKKVAFLSLMTMFVAREFWEIPVFVAGYLGLMNHYFPMFFHHILVFIVFIVLVVYSKIKFTKSNVSLLLMTLLIISPFLFIPLRSIYGIYLARTIGISVFGAVFIDGTNLVNS